MTLDLGRFTRLRDRVNELRLYERPWSAVGWAAVSLCGGASLELIAWQATASPASPLWVTPVLISVIIACALFAAFALVVVLSNRKELQRSSHYIVEEMDEIAERWRRADEMRRQGKG